MEVKQNIQQESTHQEPSILSEIVEAFELEWRLFYTFKDVVYKPDEVIHSYVAGKKQYSNPIKMMVLSGMLYWVISSFFINWDNIGEFIANEYVAFIHDIVVLIKDKAPPAGSFDDIRDFTAGAIIFFMEYLGIIAMTIALMASIVLFMLTKKFGSNFRKIAGFLCYRGSFFIVLLLLVLPTGYFSYWIPLIVMIAINIYLDHFSSAKKLALSAYLDIPEKKAPKYQAMALLIITGIGAVAGIIIAVILKL